MFVVLNPVCCILWVLLLRISNAWEYVNQSNVYGSSYKLQTVIFAGNTSTEENCRTMCAGNASCLSYTWTPGNNPGKTGCEYIHNCWTRYDDVWSIKITNKCSGKSGRKGSSPPTPSPPTPSPPKDAMNVLFVIFDDLRPNAKTWGLKQPHMPNLDALASKSLVFDRAYCQQAVCGPSRASLLSGRRPDSTQMWNFIGGFRKTSGAEKWNTWPQWFKIHGYTSYGVGKLYHPGDPANFDIPYSWSTWGGYNGQGKCPTSSGGRHGCPVDTSKYGNKTFPDWNTLVTAKQFIKSGAKNFTQKGIPFWLGVGFVKPHMPQVFPESYLNLVPALDDIVVAKNQSNPINTSPIEWGSGAEESGWQKPFDEKTQKSYRQGYYAAAAFSDALFGELLSELQGSGVANDTIIVLTADHGWGLGEHNHWIKYTNWETDARVPLIIHHPKRPKTWGQRSGVLVEHVDLYPTTAELAGVPVDKTVESIEGDSYAALFDADVSSIHEIEKNLGSHFDVAYTQYPRCNNGKPPYDFTKDDRCAKVDKTDFIYMGYSLRTDRWRYTEYAAWDGKKLKPIWNDTIPNALIELYDHQGDTGCGTTTFDDFENVNVGFKSENLNIVKKFSAQIRSFFTG